MSLVEFAVREFIVPFPMHDQPEEEVKEQEEETPSPPDPRFDEMLELVLLTLRFPFRLGLPGYYRLSGRFVMTPEAAILVLSAAHYRRGMTVVAFIFFLPLSLSLCLRSSFSFSLSRARPLAANVSEEKVAVTFRR